MILENKSNFKFTLVGIFFISFALIINPYTWVIFFKAISFPGKIAMLLYDLLSFLIGIIILYNRKNVKKLVFSLFLMALMLFSLELALQIGHYAYSLALDNEKDLPDKRVLFSPYNNEEWAMDYFYEFHGMPNSQYREFLGWDRVEYQGQYINIDSLGVRKTWNVPQNKNNNSSIYMFGGSTMWGTGARDDYTIPSIFSKTLNEDNYTFEVFNYGESGYTFLQGVIQLTLLLRSGHRPDYVIFYDGANDVYGAYQSGIAGQGQNIEITRNKLKAKYPSNKKQLKNVIRHYIGLRWTKIYDSVKRVYKYIYPSKKFHEVAAQFKDKELEKLAQGISDHYRLSYDFLNDLSRLYGFEYLAFWQPVLFTEKNITDEEKTVDRRFGDKKAAKLFNYVNKILGEKSLENFFNISDVLKEREETFYIDWVHISEKGNKVVTEKIYSSFKSQFLEK